MPLFFNIRKFKILTSVRPVSVLPSLLGNPIQNNKNGVLIPLGCCCCCCSFYHIAPPALIAKASLIVALFFTFPHPPPDAGASNRSVKSTLNRSSKRRRNPSLELTRDLKPTNHPACPRGNARFLLAGTAILVFVCVVHPTLRSMQDHESGPLCAGFALVGNRGLENCDDAGLK